MDVAYAYSYFEGIDLTAIFIFVIIFLATVLWMTCPKSDIPGPRAWPIFGNILLVSQFNSTPKREKFVEDMTRKYGPIFRMFLGPYQIVFVQGHKHLLDVLLKRGREFMDRPTLSQESNYCIVSCGCVIYQSLITVTLNLTSILYDNKTQLNLCPAQKFDISNQRIIKLGSGIVFANGDAWKGRRRFALQAMRDFGVGKSSLEEHILEEIEEVADDLEKGKGEEITDLSKVMTKASCNVIHSFIFGYRYKHDNELLQKLIKAMDNIFSGPGTLSASGLYPLLNLFMIDDLKLRGEGLSTLKSYIEQHITEHRESFDSDNIRDLIDMYLVAEKEESEHKSVMNPAALLASIIDLFAAGTDTTATTLDWSFKWMIQYPDVQKRCQEEITKVVGPGRMVRLSDRRHLSYTEATLMEIQRLSNTFLFCITGPRICPGESLARSELFLLFSNLLHRFEFSKVDPDDILSFEGISTVTTSPSPYRLKAELR
ncbi:cytochrome P450 2K3-like [Mytilus trossulus]|uniref:cytochrome P450 2K3-like n=1 Tax=Mytilus trossulus TaxID=6551 RepID=UPI0030067B3E